jgi:hypothetical protein
VRAIRALSANVRGHLKLSIAKGFRRSADSADVRRIPPLSAALATAWLQTDWTFAPAERALHDPTRYRILRFMSTEVTGVVHGNTITLDSTVPPLDGRRVRVSLEPVEAVPKELPAEDQHRLLLEWAARGPQGPIEGGESWPDETV